MRTLMQGFLSLIGTVARLGAAKLVAVLGLALVAAVACRAQDEGSPQFTLFGGPGTVISGGHAQGAAQFGASLDQTAPGAGVGYLFEVGYIGRWSKHTSGSAVFSANYMAAWEFHKRMPRALPFATVGYSRLFGTGNAVNFGGGIDYLLGDKQALRIEVRDYFAFTAPRQHNVGLRVGWVFYIRD
jgi:hypothetical protein